MDIVFLSFLLSNIFISLPRLQLFLHHHYNIYFTLGNIFTVLFLLSFSPSFCFFFFHFFNSFSGNREHVCISILLHCVVSFCHFFHANLYVVSYTSINGSFYP